VDQSLSVGSVQSVEFAVVSAMDKALFNTLQSAQSPGKASAAESPGKASAAPADPSKAEEPKYKLKLLQRHHTVSDEEEEPAPSGSQSSISAAAITLPGDFGSKEYDERGNVLPLAERIASDSEEEKPAPSGSRSSISSHHVTWPHGTGFPPNPSVRVPACDRRLLAQTLSDADITQGALSDAAFNVRVRTALSQTALFDGTPITLPWPESSTAFVEAVRAEVGDGGKGSQVGDGGKGSPNSERLREDERLADFNRDMRIGGGKGSKGEVLPDGQGPEP
jgi:hypothetical protein